MSRVMIVEDNDIMRYTIKDMLETLGHEVVADVGDANSAIKYSEELKPEIILLDLILPDITGIEILEKLKQNNNLTKIIVITALNQNKIDETVFAKGCNAILKKTLFTGRFTRYFKQIVQVVRAFICRLKARIHVMKASYFYSSCASSL